MDSKQWPEVDKYLNKYGQSVIDEMRTRLKGYDKFATGALYNNMSYAVTKDWEVVFELEDYYKFVDKGVNGYAKRRGSPFSFKPKDKDWKPKKKSKFIESLKIWCRAKGLPEGLAFPIRRNLWKFGIAPTQFYSLTIKRRQKQFETGLENAMVKDIDKQLQKEIDGRNK